jgi:hypothetical protein
VLLSVLKPPFLSVSGLAGKAPKECSPIFLQWIDSVWQITRQFPTAFEYNESALITIADEAYSCRFGTFLDNNERERWERKRQYVTSSLWTYLLDNRKWYTNKMYEPTDSTLWVCSNPRRVVLWETYWLRWDPALWPVAVSEKDAGLASRNTAMQSDSESESDDDDTQLLGEREKRALVSRASIIDISEEATL